MVKQSAVILLLMALTLGRAATGATGDLSPEELLENPPGKMHIFLSIPQKYLN